MMTLTWPSAVDYCAAIQNPQVCFPDPELCRSRVAMDPVIGPESFAGNFALVFPVTLPSRQTCAVRCFLRPAAGRCRRYQAISDALRDAGLSFTVPFEYVEDGIRIGGRWFPIVRMDWVKGLTLNAFVQQHLNDPEQLASLAQEWVRLAQELADAGVAHGDLQNGNVLLLPGRHGVEIRLIDYDGMFVPALADDPPGEVGHRDYQHPQRLREGGYDAAIDRFSHLVIYVALRCLMVGGEELWQKYDNGENLLFRAFDFDEPQQSPLWRDLMNLPDPEVTWLASRLLLASQQPLDQVPFLPDLVLVAAVSSLPAPAAPHTGINEYGEIEREQAATTDFHLAAETAVDLAPPPDVLPDASDELPSLPEEEEEKSWLTAPRIAAALAVVLAVVALAVFLARPTAKRPPLPPVARPAQEAFEIDAAEQITLDGGQSVTVCVSVRRLGYRGAIALSWADLGDGVTARAVTASETDEVVRFRLEAADDAPGGPRYVRLIATGGGIHREKRFIQLTVRARPSMRLTVTPDQVVLDPGGAPKEVKVVLERADCGDHVPELRVSEFALPSGVKSEQIGRADGGWRATVRLRLRADAAAPPGSWAVPLTGRIEALGVEQPAELKVQVRPPTLLARAEVRSVTLSPGKAVRVRIGVERGGYKGPYLVVPDDTSDRARANAKVLQKGEEVTLELRAPEDATAGKGEVSLRVMVGGVAASEALVIEYAVRPFVLMGHTRRVTSVAFSPDGKTVASAGEDKMVRLWDTASGREVPLEGHGDAVECVAFGPDGKMVASASADKTIKLWDVKLRRSVARGPNYHHPCVAFGPDGKTLASGGADGVIWLWDAATCTHTENLRGHFRRVSAVAFDRDGKTLASGGEDRKVRVWDLKTRACLFAMEGHAGEVCSVAFSRYGVLASASRDRTVKLWDRHAGKVAKTLEGHSNEVYGVAFSPDGKTLASAGADKTIRLWDVESGKNVLTLEGHTDAVTSVAFSTADAKALVSGSADKTIRLWDLRLFEGKE